MKRWLWFLACLKMGITKRTGFSVAIIMKNGRLYFGLIPMDKDCTIGPMEETDVIDRILCGMYPGGTVVASFAGGVTKGDILHFQNSEKYVGLWVTKERGSTT